MLFIDSCIFSVKFQTSAALVNVALSVTSSGYHAVTRESVQDIRWSMQGYERTILDFSLLIIEPQVSQEAGRGGGVRGHHVEHAAATD